MACGHGSSTVASTCNLDGARRKRPHWETICENDGVDTSKCLEFCFTSKGTLDTFGCNTWPGIISTTYSTATTDQDAAGNLLLEMKGDVQLWKQFISRIRDSSRRSTQTELEAATIVEKQLLATQQSIKEVEAVLAARRKTGTGLIVNAGAETEDPPLPNPFQHSTNDDSRTELKPSDSSPVSPSKNHHLIAEWVKQYESNKATALKASECVSNCEQQTECGRLENNQRQRARRSSTRPTSNGLEKGRSNCARAMLAGNLVYYPPLKRRRHNGTNSLDGTKPWPSSTIYKCSESRKLELGDNGTVDDSGCPSLTCSSSSHESDDETIDVRGLWMSTTDDDASGSDSTTDEENDDTQQQDHCHKHDNCQAHDCVNCSRKFNKFDKEYDSTEVDTNEAESKACVLENAISA